MKTVVRFFSKSGSLSLNRLNSKKAYFNDKVEFELWKKDILTIDKNIIIENLN